MKAVLVDTDVLINFLRGKQKAKEFLLGQLDSGPILQRQRNPGQIYLLLMNVK